MTTKSIYIVAVELSDNEIQRSILNKKQKAKRKFIQKQSKTIVSTSCTI